MKDGRQAFFLFLPDGEDPDSLVRTEGAAGFDERLHAATPLSQFVFDELAKDVNLSGLEGKARLAERAKPLLSQIPDGAFRDLMFARLAEITGVGAAPAAATQAPKPMPPRTNRSGTATPRRSMVRTAIEYLLQQPALATSIEPPYLFNVLAQPGIPLLVELIGLCRSRPDIRTGAVLEHFAGSEHADALHKLALTEPLAPPERWKSEFLGALKRLDLDTLRQREGELKAKIDAGGLAALTDAEKDEQRAMQPAIRRIEAELRELSVTHTDAR
jgi:DNA primase